jgi:molybdate transport system substrate-binding protein
MPIKLRTNQVYSQSTPRVAGRKCTGARRPLPAIIAGASAPLGIGVLAAALSFLPAPAARAADSVNVLYAGSLVNLMERGVGPAFDKATGNHFQGYAGGSNKLGHEIKGKLRQGDVFISANPKVDQFLMGSANGDWVSWYLSFAQSPLAIGYNAASKFAADFNSKPWYRVLLEPGIRIGRTDPKLDPKGRLTLVLMQQAESHYKMPGLAEKVLGAPENPKQVLPEETLVGRLQSGEIDAGFFYSTETATAKIPTVKLPAEIAPKAVYTITVLHAAPHPAAAETFIAFLLGPEGRKIMQEHGLDLRKLAASGDASAVPAKLQPLLASTK